MKKKYFVLFVTVIFLSTVWSNFGFAQLSINGVDLKLNTDLSAAALSNATSQLAWLETNLESLLDDSSLEGNQKAIVRQTVEIIKKKRASLDDTEIKVYFADEIAPGKAYEKLHTHYKEIKQYSPFRDIEDAQFKAMLEDFPDEVPIHILDVYKNTGPALLNEDVPKRFEKARADLEDLIDGTHTIYDTYSDYEVRAAAGASGNERVSIMTFYISNVDPDTGNDITDGGEQIFEVFTGTTLVIATEN